jgi:poly-gamma-glutamate synthesis protein (capsule biosynthesis protein)
VTEGLRFAGFDVLSLANNHIMDWGREALVDTVTHLREAGFGSVGAGVNAQEANQPLIREVGRTRIAFFAYTTLYPKSLEATTSTAGISRFNLEHVVKAIQEIRASTHTIIISFHWGDEYREEANEEQKKIAYALVDAGADLIIGHHPHVVQEVEQYGRGWIAYSLGNFVFDQNFSDATQKGLFLRATLHRGKVVSVESTTVAFTPTFQPYVPESIVVQ